MAVKNTAQVVIDGKIITLGGYESEEYFQKVAAYMNNKISELSQMPGYSRQAMETKHTLLSLKVKNYVRYQIGALAAFTKSYGMKLQHVAPHGAMGNACQYDEDISTAICEAICEYDKDLIVYYCAGAVLGDIAESKGLRTASEIFADRAYMDDLSLVNC